MNNLNQEKNCQKTINNNLTSTIDKLIKSFQQQQNNSLSSTNLKPCSPSPPLLLLQSGTEETIKMDKIHSDISNSSSIDKPLALIQASDLNEMNQVLKSLKNNFPNVTIHLCLNNINETNLKEERKMSPRHSLTPSSYEKNCLTASYLSDKFKHSERPSSLDNSSLSACMERQESKDSGFWSMSKFSFESTKSLSISDSHSNDSTSLNPQYSHNTNNSLLIPGQLNQFNKNQTVNNNNYYLNTNNVNNKTNNLSTNNEEKTSTQTQNTSPNASSNINENDLSSSRKYLSSPVGFSQTPIYNWKKWKKGQAWRYNSSNSNLSQSDCSSNTEDGNTRNSSLNYASFDSTTINPVHTNENDTNDTKQNIPNLNLTHANSHFSNSFEIPSSTTTNTNNNNQTLSSNLTIQSSNLNHHHSWSSTSRLDQLSSQIQINNSNYLNQSQHHQHQQQSYLNTFEPAKAQKRRGKLVRDRTIDNPDDHQSSLTALNGLNLSSNNLTNNHIKLENTRFDSISSLISPLSISSNKDKENNNDSIIMNNSSNSTSPNTNTTKQNYSGRVSPPEKRVSLTNNDNDQSQNSSLIMSHLNSNTANSSKYLSTEHPNKNFSISSSMVMNNRPTSKASASSSLSSSPAPTPSSIQDVMNSAAVVAAAAAIAAVMSNNNSNTGNNENNPAKSINYDSNCLLNQYDFYKDLQSKLIIKANDNEEMNQNKQKYLSTTHSSLFNNNINNDNSNNNKNNNISNNSSPSSSSPMSSPNSKLLIMRQNNFLSNQHSKLVSRSNSSPSYSSLSSLPTTNAQTNQLIPSQIQFSSPSSTCLFQSTTATNTTNPLNPSIPNHFDASKLNIFSQVQSYNNSLAFNNKSISTCSLPLVTFSQATTPFNLSTNKLNQIDNNSKNFFGSSNRLTNPPEIVITESKIDQDQIDYEQQQQHQQQQHQQQQETQQLNKLNQFDQIKQENIFIAANLFSNEHKLNESVSNVYDNSFKKEQENSLNNKLFENWKNLNPFIHQLSPTNNTILTTNNMNNLNSNKMNVSNNSNVANASSKQAKPHVCPNCQKRFARSDMLIRHSRLHSGVRPYRCNRCGQEFSRSDHLNTHLRTHTGEKPYSCPHPKCTYAACRKDMITRHLKVHAKNRLTLSFDNANLAANVVNNNNNNTNATDNNNTNTNTNTSNMNKGNQLAMSEAATSKLIQFANGLNSVSFESANIGFLNTASTSNLSDTKAKMEDLKDIKSFEIFKQSK